MIGPHVVVLGATGQVGRALGALLPEKGYKTTALDRQSADLSQPYAVTAALEKLNPQWVINAAAYTDVARAESEESLATVINGVAPGLIARWCAGRGIPFIHYSTDYVFAGEGTAPQSEETPTRPLNAYGRSKLAGEKLVAADGDHWLVFRTSWVYAEHGKNFLLTMLKLGAEREKLTVVSDQWGAPSYASDLAQATLDVIEKSRQLRVFPSGIYNLCNTGETTWHGFASAIFEQARRKGMPLKIKEIAPVPTSQYPSPVVRPLNSRLSHEKLQATFGLKLRAWDEALKACMEKVV